MKKTYFLIAWIIAMVASSYSIYLSQYVGHQPCLFCWYERACFFPLAILPIAPLFRGEATFFPYLLPLPIIGTIIAIWQIVYFATSHLCSLAGGCDQVGAVGALVAFILITLSLILGIQKRDVV